MPTEQYEHFNDQRLEYRYQYLPGKYKFFLQGRIMMSREDYGFIPFVLIFILVPFGLFLGFQ